MKNWACCFIALLKQDDWLFTLISLLKPIENEISTVVV